MSERLEELVSGVGMEDAEQPLKGDGVTLFVEDEEDHRLFRLFVDRFHPDNGIIHDVTNRLMKARPTDQIEIRISSGGGSVREGIRIYNAVEDRFKGRIQTTIESSAYSMGAMLFCRGDRRVIYPDSDIMFHDYATVMMGKGGDLEDQARHLRKMEQRTMKHIISNGWLSKQEYNRMVDGKEFWFDADEMVKRRLATHVRVEGEEIAVEDYRS